MVEFYNKIKDKSSEPNYGKDVGGGLLSGIGKGVSGIMSLLEEAPNLLAKGISLGVDKNSPLGSKIFDDQGQVKRINVPIIPSYKEAEEMRMKTPFMNYEPQTRAGEIASTIGEYATPGGLFGKAPLAIGAIAGGGKEVSKQFGAGEGLSTGIGVGIDVVGNLLLALRNPAHLVKLRESVKNLQKTDIDKANEIIAKGKEFGIDLSAPEALAQATGDKTVLQVMDAVGQTDYGSTVIGQFTKDRFSQVSDSNLKWLNENFPTIDPKNVDTSLITNNFVNQLIKTQDELQKNINLQARTLKEGGWAKFDQGTDLSNSINGYIKNIQDKLKGGTLSTNEKTFYNDILKNFPAKTDGTINNTYLQTAYNNLVDEAKALRVSGKSKKALIYDNEAKNILNILETNQYYKNASDFTKKANELLNPRLDALSIQGQIKEGINPTFTLVKNTMFSDNISPTNIIRLQKEMSKIDGGADLFQEMVGLLMTKRIQKVIPAKQTENIGGKVLESFMGKGNDKLSIQYVRSVAISQGKDPDLAEKGFKNYMEVLEASSRLPSLTGGSRTQQTKEFVKSLNSLGYADISLDNLNLIDKIIPGLRTLVKNDRAKDLSKMFFGENAINEMIRISNANMTKTIESMISVSNNTAREVSQATQEQNNLNTNNQQQKEVIDLREYR